MTVLETTTSRRDELILQCNQAHADAMEAESTAVSAMKAALDHAIACGGYLSDLKEIVKDGGEKWLPFVREHLTIEPRRVQERMQLWRRRAELKHCTSREEAIRLISSCPSEHSLDEVVAAYQALPGVEVKVHKHGRALAIEMLGLSKTFNNADEAWEWLPECRDRVERLISIHPGSGKSNVVQGNFGQEPHMDASLMRGYQSCAVCIHFREVSDSSYECAAKNDGSEYQASQARAIAAQCATFVRNPENSNGYAEMRYEQVCNENAASTERIAAEDRAITSSGGIRVSDSGDRVTISPQSDDRVTDIREKMTSSLTCEHYTPRDILECVYELGDIDLDPCSNSDDSDIANVNALRYFTVEDDGLSQSWCNRDGSPATVFINPPYSMPKRDEQGNIVINPKTNKPVMVSVMGQWSDKILHEWESGHLRWAIALVKGDTSTQWHRKFRDFIRCEYAGRVEFLGNEGPATFCTHLIYIGEDIASFYWNFAELGDIYQRLDSELFGE